MQSIISMKKLPVFETYIVAKVTVDQKQDTFKDADIAVSVEVISKKEFHAKIERPKYSILNNMKLGDRCVSLRSSKYTLVECGGNFHKY